MNTKNLLIVILLVTAFGAGLLLGRSGIETPLDTVVETVEDAFTDTNLTDGTQTQKNTTENSAQENKAESVIDVANSITPEQKKMLETFGLEPDEIVITPTMVACAEAKVGGARLEEIKNGATPSFLEGTALFNCYH